MNKTVMMVLFIGVAAVVALFIFKMRGLPDYRTLAPEPATVVEESAYSESQVATDEAVDATLDTEMDELDSGINELSEDDFAANELSNTELGL